MTANVDDIQQVFVLSLLITLLIKDKHITEFVHIYGYGKSQQYQLTLVLVYEDLRSIAIKQQKRIAFRFLHLWILSISIDTMVD